MALTSVHTCAYLLVIAMSALSVSSTGKVVCPCKTMDGCVRPSSMKPADKEVLVASSRLCSSVIVIGVSDCFAFIKQNAEVKSPLDLLQLLYQYTTL